MDRSRPQSCGSFVYSAFSYAGINAVRLHRQSGKTGHGGERRCRAPGRAELLYQLWQRLSGQLRH